MDQRSRGGRRTGYDGVDTREDEAVDVDVDVDVDEVDTTSVYRQSPLGVRGVGTRCDG